MKKIFGLILALVMLVSVFAVLPASAEESEAKNGWNVLLNSGIVLNYYENGAKVESVDVAAKEMAVNHTVNGHTMSVKEYLQDLIKKDYGENTKALAQALLNYGAAAQKYFNYQADSLVGTPVTDTTALKDANAPAKVVDDADGIYKGATLVLDGTMKLRFYFKGETRTGTVDGTDNVSAKSNGAGNCYFEVAVMPYAISESVTVVVEDTTVTYAPINYLQAKAENADLSEMVASIYAYGVAAKAYYISEGCEHSYAHFEIATYPTIFTEGKRNTRCNICGELVEEGVTISKNSSAKIEVVDANSDSAQDAPNATASIREALGDKTFKPGNDLYLEFSILWNDTMANNMGKGIGFGHIALYEDMTVEKRTDSNGNKVSNYVQEFSWLYYKEDAEWCPFVGGFEFSGNHKAGNFPFGPTYQKGSDNANDYVFIGGGEDKELDGWHRIGVKYTQNVYQENGEFTYDVTATVYVDGVKVSQQIMDWGAMFYSVEVDDNGKPVYVQNDKIADYYAVFYRVGSAELPEGVTENAYFVFADCYLTVGNRFAVTVTPDNSPEAKNFTQDDLTFSGKQYFEVVNGCEAGHVWADEATVDVAATCTTPGSATIKCIVCSTINEDAEVVTIPATGHKYIYNTIIVSTVFSEGLKTGVCCNENCDETDPNVVVPKTEATVIEQTNNKIAPQETKKIADALGNKTFAPGNDLYLEFSVLFNGTTDNVEKGSALGWGHISSNPDVTDEKYITNNFSWLAYRDGNSYCPFKGSFEFSEAEEIIYGPKWKLDGTENDYVIIDGLDGWHRIGVQYTQNVYKNSDGTFDYDVTATVYVDGVAVSQQIMDWGARFYSAEYKNGEIVYTQNEDIADYYAVFYRIGNPAPKKDKHAYFVFADMYLTVGDGFVMNVAPVEEPEDKTITVGEEELSAKEYFKVRSILDCNNDEENHTWETMPTIDVAPTCTENGSSTIRCAVCDAVKPGSEEVVPAGHRGLETTVVPTVFSTGLKTGKCKTCGKNASEVIPMTEAITVIDGLNYGKSQAPNKTGSIDDALGNKTFAPGNDLYLEFSILWNNTMKNASGNGIGFGGIALREDMNLEKVDGKSTYLHQFSWLYYKASEEWCNFVGGFEFSEAESFVYGPTWIKNNNDNDPDEFVIIDGLDGWHRIGVQYTQNVYEKDGTFDYDVTITVYVDGVVVSQQIMDWGDLFYSASYDSDNNIVYTQNKNITDYYAVFYRIGSANLSKGEHGYFIFADEYLTVGDGFVMNVAPVEDPEEKTYDPDGINLSAKEYFEVRRSDCADGKHVFAGPPTVDFEATCTEDGQKSIKCSFCGKTDPNSIEVIEAGHKGIETIVVPTVFSDGLKAGTCTECGVSISEDLPKTDAITVINTNSMANDKDAPNATKNIGKALGGKTFAPGNDLYLEFSILWNETMANTKDGKAVAFGQIALYEDMTNEKNGDQSRYAHEFSWLYYKADSTWCPFVGGFEFSEADSFTYGPVWIKNNQNNDREEFVFIGDYGWHRIGVQYTQNYNEVSKGEFTYDVTATVYVDGIAVSQQIMNWGAQFYSVERVGDELVYTQNENIADYYAVFYRVGNPAASTDAYFVFADEYLTVGDGFVMNVAPVAEPEDKTITIGDENLSAKEYFETRRSDCADGKHVFAGPPTVDKDVTCEEDGQKSIKCSLCGLQDPNSIEVIESAGQHVWADEVISIKTMFSDGIVRSTCGVCDKVEEKNEGKESPKKKVITDATSGMFAKGEKLIDVLEPGEHFYPTEENPNGKDLYIEFSLLFNESLFEYASDRPCVYTGMFSASDGTTNRMTPYHLLLGEIDGWWCTHIGGFEPDSNEKNVYGPSMEDKGGKKDFPNLFDENGEIEYGWHRIGLRYHQTTKNDNGTAKHTITAHLYIDGVAVSAFEMVKNQKNSYQNLLYTATYNDDGSISYGDCSSKAYIFAFMLNNIVANEGKEVYFVYGDMHITAGEAYADGYRDKEVMAEYNGFVVPVEPVDNPEETTGTVAGIENLPTTEYYKVKNN